MRRQWIEKWTTWEKLYANSYQEEINNPALRNTDAVSGSGSIISASTETAVFRSKFLTRWTRVRQSAC